MSSYLMANRLLSIQNSSIQGSTPPFQQLLRPMQPLRSQLWPVSMTASKSISHHCRPKRKTVIPSSALRVVILFAILKIMIGGQSLYAQYMIENAQRNQETLVRGFAALLLLFRRLLLQRSPFPELRGLGHTFTTSARDRTGLEESPMPVLFRSHC